MMSNYKLTMYMIEKKNAKHGIQIETRYKE
jgi:hypothetical protein